MLGRNPTVAVALRPGRFRDRAGSLPPTLRAAWGLGDPFTQRDASARTFEHVFSRDTPRDPTTWAAVDARHVPAWTMDREVVGKGLSTLGKGMGPHLIAKAREMGVEMPTEIDAPEATLTRTRIVPFLRDISAHFFPLLAADSTRTTAS